MTRNIIKSRINLYVIEDLRMIWQAPSTTAHLELQLWGAFVLFLI